MNREKILFLAILVIAVLWGGAELANPYVAEDTPSATRLMVELPDIPSYADQGPSQRFLMLVANTRELIASLPEMGRTMMEPHSDLLPVEPAVLELPRALSTAVVMPPLYPFPLVPWYPSFRVAEFPVVSGGPPEEEVDPFGDDDDDDADDETTGEFEERVMRERQKWKFVESEWDYLTLDSGVNWYGRISLKKEQIDQGYRKFDLLLPENRNLEFHFEKINKGKGTIEGTGFYAIEGSDVAEVGFKDTIENRYMIRRTLDRIEPDSVSKLRELARWMLEIAEQEGYDRSRGLELAVDTAREAIAAKPGQLESVLLLGEALHRSFRYNEEFELYKKILEVKDAAAVHARVARIYRKLGLLDMEEQELTTALVLAPGDTRARLARAGARFKLGLYDEADKDFAEVSGGGTAEEALTAREGRARVLLLKGDPTAAAALLAGTDDLDSLVTLGAALYAQRDFTGALEAFERVVDEDSEHALAMTNLGFAMVQTAETWEDIDRAMEIFDKARELSPLNYFYPPLGQGFAEVRRGRTVESVDRFTAAETTLPTDPYVHYILGVSYLRDQRFEDAREEFLIALKLDYRFLDALIGAGEASLGIRVVPEEGEEDLPFRMAWADARGYLERAVTMEQRRYRESTTLPVKAELIVAHYHYGRAILLSGDMPLERRLRDAEVQFQAILELDDRHVPALNAMGYIAYGKRGVNDAYRFFDQARSMARSGADDADRTYGEAMKKRILDAESRRIWRDQFERRDGTPPANGWLTKAIGNIRWSIRNGEVVTSGRWPATGGTLWLTRGDRSLNMKFIAVGATVRVLAKLRQTFRMFVFTRRGDYVGAAVGLARNTRGEVVFLHRRGGDPVGEWTEVILTDEGDRAVLWPSDPVSLRIARIDAQKGVFAAYFDGRMIGTVDLGVRRRQGKLEIGFNLEATNGEEVEAGVDEVEVEIYEK